MCYVQKMLEEWVGPRGCSINLVDDPQRSQRRGNYDDFQQALIYEVYLIQIK
jgi:hypothetical protein